MSYPYIIKVILLGGLFFSLSQDIHANQYAENNKASQMLVWEQLPYQWNEGAFLGNGIVGTVIYVDSVDNSLTLQICRPDVTDHRKVRNGKTSLGEKDANVMFDFCRLDVGKFKLFPCSKITGGKMSLDIYNGVASGTLMTKDGLIEWHAYTPYDSEVNVITYQSSSNIDCRFIPGNPQSPRVQVFPWTKKEQNYTDNPHPDIMQTANEGTCVQSLLAGGDYATFWKRTIDGNNHVVYLSTANEVPSANRSLGKAKENVNRAMSKGDTQLLTESGRWWNNYLSRTFISIPDKKLENFYAIQMYKLATCSNPQGPAMDNFGTFFKMSQWPGMWWNLNVQLTYQSVYPNNRMEQGYNFQKLMDGYFCKIIKNIPTQKAGDYGWALHNYYLYMSYSGATAKAYRQLLCPKIKALLAVYETHLKDVTGRLRLCGMESPEYEGFKTYHNSNYNLAVLRWLIKTLVNEEPANDKSVIKWCGIMNRLPDYPTDENGMMIAEGTPLSKSHRHYSHLLAYYPLHLMNIDDSTMKSTAEKSIDHWLTADNGKELAGYSYTGSASLYALLGNGEKAYRQLNHFINEPIGISLLLPNTLYVESNGRNPVIETPLSASTALAEMMIQSWGNMIRIFPAIPAEWSTCCFSNLRAEGGFSISAQRKEGVTTWVTITSECGKPCKIRIDGWTTCYCLNGKDRQIKKDGKNTYEIRLKKGESITLASDRSLKEANFTYATNKNGGSNFYGVKKGQGLKNKMDWPEVKINQ